MQWPRLARDLMVSRLVTLSPEVHVFDGIAQLLRHNISGAPVVDADRNYFGVFSEKCCMNVLTATAHWANVLATTGPPRLLAQDFMVTRLVNLSRDMDVFEAIGYLLDNHISGAPVIDDEGQFLGVFSEKTSMRVLIASAYDQLPTSRVGTFMNTDRGRIISETTELLAVAQIFIDTPYRRLPVLKDGKLLGQICRRDVLRAQHHLAQYVRDREHALLQGEALRTIDANVDPNAPAHQRSFSVTEFMDGKARTIDEETDLLRIAQIFLETPYRRLPVLRDGKLIGQISRRDLLQAAHDLMEIVPVRTEQPSLFLSAIAERTESPIAY